MVTITISGTPGSGKSTVGRLLAERLGLRYVNSGIVFREMAQNYQMSLEEFGKYAETHQEVDQQVDDKQRDILSKGDVIVEGRIAGWIAVRNQIPAIKIMIDADVQTRAKRIVKREKGSITTRKKEIQIREKSEATRYKQYYNIDLEDTSIYDLFIDSSNKSPEEIVTQIIRYTKG